MSRRQCGSFCRGELYPDAEERGRSVHRQQHRRRGMNRPGLLASFIWHGNEALQCFFFVYNRRSGLRLIPFYSRHQ